MPSGRAHPHAAPGRADKGCKRLLAPREGGTGLRVPRPTYCYRGSRPRRGLRRRLMPVLRCAPGLLSLALAAGLAAPALAQNQPPPPAPAPTPVATTTVVAR